MGIETKSCSVKKVLHTAVERFAQAEDRYIVKKNHQKADPVNCAGSGVIQWETEYRASAGALVVRDALCLRSTGGLGGEGKNDEGDDIGHHVVDIAGEIQRCQRREAHIGVG